MLTIICKCTEHCNASCVYCAVRDKESKRERMTIGVLRRFLERVAEYLAADPTRRVNITWHGGEPALMGPEFYRAVHALQREILGVDAPRLLHSMQSNVTLVDQALAERLKDLGLKSVGTSYEHVPGIRGLGPRTDSETYCREFFRGLGVLRKNGIGAGVIYVVTSRALDRPEETMIFLGNLLGKTGRGHVRINPLYREGEASRDANRDLFVTPEEYGHFLGRAYRYWYPRRHVLDGVAPFSAICRAVEGDRSRLSCEESGVCGNTHLAVSHAGDAYQCGRAMDNGSLSYGNILDRSFDEMFCDPLKREVIARPEHLRATECAGCAIWDFCHGGCPVDSFLYHQDWRHRTYFCRTRQIFVGDYVLPLHEAEKERRKRREENANPHPQAIV